MLNVIIVVLNWLIPVMIQVDYVIGDKQSYLHRYMYHRALLEENEERERATSYSALPLGRWTIQCFIFE